MARARLEHEEGNNDNFDEVRTGGRDHHGFADDVGMWRKHAASG
jgi:hypothetical protein